MTKTIMIQGTGSSVGKSLITAGLCRIFARQGYRVAPFKAQNMALNSFITPEGGEMGRAQVVQAEASGIAPHVDMNPILLKPTSDRKAQIILNGKVFGNADADEYHGMKASLKPGVQAAYDRLAARFDRVVIEGAGSPAEINLMENDLVNMGMAAMADCPVILVGDIDRGGVFASLYGTVMLLPEEDRKRIKGMIINKFRGDETILEPGIRMIEEKMGIPVLGVLPYAQIDIEDEDSLSERFHRHQDKESAVKVEVVYLPRVSNFTDFNALETLQDVNLRYVMRGESLEEPDVVIIPGSKNTIEDMVYLRNSGLAQQIVKAHRRGARIVGICGGYQMLGKLICDPHGTESSVAEISGLGLLDVETVFEPEKMTTQVTGSWLSTNGLDGIDTLSEQLTGYEIHMGRTVLGNAAKPLLQLNERLGSITPDTDGAVSPDGMVFGSYIHGIFDNHQFTQAYINAIRQSKGLGEQQGEAVDFKCFKEQEYDKLADLMSRHLDLRAIEAMLTEVPQ